MKYLALIVAVLLTGCGAARQEAIDYAESEMRRAIASDIELTMLDATAYYKAEERVRYVVCGTVELHRPSDVPEMNLDHSRERFVAEVHRNKYVGYEFEANPPRPEFNAKWQKRCN